MGLMDRLLGRKENKVEQAPVEKSENNNMKFQTLQRRDGSKIDIMPVVDKMGNQTYEQVFNERTKQMQLMPKFVVSSPEIAKLKGADFTTILMDINKDALYTLQGADWVANALLSGERMSKVINEYGGYAGGLSIDQTGQITGKYIDPGIVNGLNISNKQRWEEYQANQAVRDKEDEAKIKANAEQKGVNIKTSHAEDLSYN